MKSLIILIWDYLKSEGRRAIKVLILPSIAFFVIGLRIIHICPSSINSFYSNLLTILGILIGFSISFHAIILSADSEDFKKAKLYFGEDNKDSKPLSLFHREVAGNILLIIVQAVLILINILIPFFYGDFDHSSWLLAINVAGIVFVVELLISSVIDSYLIVTTRKK